MNGNTSIPNSTLKILGLLLACAFSTLAFSWNLGFEPLFVPWVVLFALMCLAWRQHPLERMPAKALLVLGVFTFLLCLSFTLGHHIAVDSELNPESPQYYGFAWECFISSYGIIDLVSFIAMLPCVFVLVSTPYAIAVRRQQTQKSSAKQQKATNPNGLQEINLAWFVGGAIALFIMWMPYLLTYWPGFIFGDSLYSVREVLGIKPWDNHHPVVYTAFLQLCFEIAHAFGFGNTEGSALSSILQMAFMACCFSFMAQWTVARGRLNKLWGLAIVLVFGITPFIATYSIAMWKDSIFSSAVMVLTLLLFDYVITKGRISSQSRCWVVAFAVFMLIVAVFRSNGMLLVIAVTIWLLVELILAKTKSKSQNRNMPKVATAIAVTITIVALVFTGPITTSLGIKRVEGSEGAGIFYNQMARVVTFEGNLSEDDLEYLDSLIPLEQYAGTYRPCCFDELKYAMQYFDADFNMQAMLPHWASILVKNPRRYFEAWELQTYGYWAINGPKLITFRNIGGCVPRNTTTESPIAEELETEFDIYDRCLLPGDTDFWRTLFPQDTWSPPAALFFWIALYLACLFMLIRRGNWALSLLPILMLYFSMFIATPIAYWPRYVAAAYFLVPFFALIFYLLVRPSGIPSRRKRV